MKRTPAPIRRDRPRCYGISHDSYLTECRICPFRRECKPECDYWRDLIESSKPKPIDIRKRDVSTLYADMHRKHFNKEPSRGYLYARAQGQLAAAEKHCLIESIDLEAFITAQMVILRDWLSKTKPWNKIGFQPNFLSGPKATERYNQYVEKLDRTRRHAKVSQADHHPELVKIRHAMLTAEVEIGQRIVGGVTGHERRAARVTRSPKLWWAISGNENGNSTLMRLTLIQRYGEPALLSLWMEARRIAVETILNVVKSGLSKSVVLPSQINWLDVRSLVRKFGEPNLRGVKTENTVEGLWTLGVV
jgi:hypothetical protein